MLLISSTSIFAQEATQLVLHMKDKTETVISLSELDSITFRTPADDGELSLTCTIDELTPSHATYTIHANQSNDAYYQFLMSESTYNAMIEQYGNLQNHDQANCRNTTKTQHGKTSCACRWSTEQRLSSRKKSSTRLSRRQTTSYITMV